MIKKYFLTGLATLLPAAVTVWIALFVIGLLTNPFMGAVTHFLKSFPALKEQVPEEIIRTFSHILILILLLAFTFFLGLIARRFFFHKLLDWGSHFLQKIPLVNKIYKTSKDMVESLFNPKNRSFQQVVLIPFPYPGAYCLGLITSTAPQTCQKAPDDSMMSVFIPTTPNPTTGYLVMRPKKDLILLSMSSQEAIQYIISCAVIQPTYKEEQS
jgi:uncharacterized membrane protein